MSASSTTTSSSNMHSTEGSSVTSVSDSYTTTSYSTVDPPSHLDMKVHSERSVISAMSDPSAASVSTAHAQNTSLSNMPVFSPVLEETSSALEDASSYGGVTNNRTGNSHDTGGNSTVSSARLRTSVDAEGVNIEITNTSSLPPSPVGPVLPLECDYDKNPTELYHAIESKNWEIIETLFNDEPLKAQRQVATWVTRKETNGKLRWRLLPIHAAIIFQSPSNIVAKLLNHCPEAAQAKDDQGMLPLHLAFRTKNTDWEAIEELISANPSAIFARDRKDRTPLECGAAAANAAIMAEVSAKAATESEASTAAGSKKSGLMRALSPRAKAAPSTTRSSSSSSLGGRTVSPEVQKAIFAAMDMYSQISVQDQLQSAMNTSRKALEARIGAVQDSHVATLTQLKKDWENQRQDLNQKIQGYRSEIQNLKSDFNIQQELLEEKVRTEMELVDKLTEVTTALESKTVFDDAAVGEIARDITIHSADLEKSNKQVDALKRQNKELLLLLETLLDQQNSLKLSLDKLAWDSNAKNQEQKELLNKYMLSSEQSTEMSESFSSEWQSRLETTSIDVSTKLSKILREQKSTLAGYDGEEKKENSGVISVASSRKDP